MQSERVNAYKAAPAAMRAVQQVEAYIQQCGLEKSLIELVKMRASQINGCAYCLDMHSKNARRAGENRAAALSPQRLARFRAGRT
jgi:AhpD family alkylhydroperoxidase